MARLFYDRSLNSFNNRSSHLPQPRSLGNSHAHRHVQPVRQQGTQGICGGVGCAATYAATYAAFEHHSFLLPFPFPFLSLKIPLGIAVEDGCKGLDDGGGTVDILKVGSEIASGKGFRGGKRPLHPYSQLSSGVVEILDQRCQQGGSAFLQHAVEKGGDGFSITLHCLPGKLMLRPAIRVGELLYDDSVGNARKDKAADVGVAGVGVDGAGGGGERVGHFWMANRSVA